jgi:hypothetical protein
MMYLMEGPGGLLMLWTMTTTAEPAQPVELVEQVVVAVAAAVVLCSEVAGIGQSQDDVVDEGGNPAVDWPS